MPEQTSDTEALAQVLCDHYHAGCSHSKESAGDYERGVAQAVIAAGWVPPHIIGRAHDAEARLLGTLEAIRDSVTHVVATDEPDATPDVLAILSEHMGEDWLNAGAGR